MLTIDSKHLTIEAAEGSKIPRLSILAYNGGVLRLTQGDTVIDLEGISLPAEIPLLADHKNELDGFVGMGVPSVQSGRLTVEGTLAVDSEGGKKVLAAHKNGLKFQASVGVSVQESRRLPSGKKVDVNGQTFTAGRRGLTIATKTTLNETSFTPIGLDRSTSVTIAAAKGRKKMSDEILEVESEEQSTDEIRAAERKRVSDIFFAAGGVSGSIKHKEIVDQALEENWSPDRVELASIRATMPKSFINEESSYDHAAGNGPGQIVEAALLARAGFSDVAEKEFGERIMERSKDLHSASFIDIIKAGYRMAGVQVPRDKNELIRTAFSNQGQINASGASAYSLPMTLSNTMGRVLESTYRETAESWRRFCAVRNVSNFHDATSIRPSYIGEMEQVGKDGTLKPGSLDESFFTYKIDTFGKVLKVDRKTIINDDLGFLDDVAPAYGRMAARAVADLVFKTLLDAGSSYFDGTLNNAGTDALDVTSLGVAITAMQKQVDDQGNDIDVQPVTLLVPPELGSIAKTALQSEYTERIAENTAGAVDSVRPTGNPQRNAVKLEVESRLSNTAKFTNADANNWFLFGKPTDIPMVVAFLNGKQVPTIDFFGFDQDPSTLSATWRIYMDYGASLGDYRAAYKSDAA